MTACTVIWLDDPSYIGGETKGIHAKNVRETSLLVAAVGVPIPPWPPGAGVIPHPHHRVQASPSVPIIGRWLGFPQKFPLCKLINLHAILPWANNKYAKLHREPLRFGPPASESL